MPGGCFLFVSWFSGARSGRELPDSPLVSYWAPPTGSILGPAALPTSHPRSAGVPTLRKRAWEAPLHRTLRRSLSEVGVWS